MNRIEQTDHGQAALSEALSISFRILRWIMGLLLLAYLASGLYIVNQHEKALVLVMGKLQGAGDTVVKEPGFHWTWPRPVSEIIRIPAARVQKLDLDAFWYEQAAGFQDNADIHPGTPLAPGRDGYTVSGDANLLHSRWTARYTIDDPVAYALRQEDAVNALANELQRAVLHQSAVTPVDAALRTGIDAFREGVERRLRSRLISLETGIRMQGLDLVAVIPPRQVEDAFNDVVQAEQEQARTVSDSRAYATRIVNEADGEAGRLLSEGQAYKDRLINEISADADSFRRIAEQMKRNPDLIRDVLREETVRQALANVDNVYVVPSGGDGKRQIRLRLGPERKNPLSFE